MDRYRADGLYRGYCEGQTPESNRGRTMRNIEECGLEMRWEFRLYGTQDLQYRIPRTNRVSDNKGRTPESIC